MEFVWVVPRRKLFPRAIPQGLLRLAPEDLEERFLGPTRDEGFFMERRYAEEHPEYQQPIPYVAVGRGAEILALTRLPSQGERRLHGLRSVGVGGHVNPCDQEADDLLREACRRELHEELVLPDRPLPLEPIGLLNDDTTAVGAVHVGIVYRLDASRMEVSIRETSAMTGGFEPLDDLVELAHAPEPPFESWSTLLLRSGALGAGAESHSVTV